MVVTYLANKLADLIAQGICLNEAISILEIHEGMTPDQTAEVISIVF